MDNEKDKDNIDEDKKEIMDYSNKGIIFSETSFSFIKDKNSTIKFKNVQSQGNNLIKIGDFESLGIGGLDKEFSKKIINF
jgi:hypothetical protein